MNKTFHLTSIFVAAHCNKKAASELAKFGSGPVKKSIVNKSRTSDMAQKNFGFKSNQPPRTKSCITTKIWRHVPIAQDHPDISATKRSSNFGSWGRGVGAVTACGGK